MQPYKLLTLLFLVSLFMLPNCSGEKSEKTFNEAKEKSLSKQSLPKPDDSFAAWKGAPIKADKAKAKTAVGTMQPGFDVGNVVEMVSLAMRPDKKDPDALSARELNHIVSFKNGETRLWPMGSAMTGKRPCQNEWETSFAGGKCGKADSKPRVQSRNLRLSQTPFILKTESITVGGKALVDMKAGQLKDDDAGQVTWAFSESVMERVLNRRHTIEQRWRFLQPFETKGDLRISIQTSGMAYAETTDRGIHFVDEATGLGVNYSHAVVIDADDNRHRIEARWTGSRIALLVPGKKLDEMRFPIVIDPTLEPEVGIDIPSIYNGINNLESTKIANAETGNAALVVWRENIVDVIDDGGTPEDDSDDIWGEIADAGDIWAARVQSHGAVLDPRGILISRHNKIQSDPDVASADDGWVVVWSDERNSLQTMNYMARVDGKGRLLDDGDGVLIDDVSSTGLNQHYPRISGHAGIYAISYLEEDDELHLGETVYNIKVKLFAHDADATEDDRLTPLTSSPLAIVENEALFLDAKPDIGTDNEYFYIAYIYNNQVYGQAVDYTGVLKKAEFRICEDGDGAQQKEPAVEGGFEYDTDGVTTAFKGLIVTFADDRGGDFDIYGAVIDLLSETTISKRCKLISGASGNEWQPSVGYSDETFFVTYMTGSEETDTDIEGRVISNFDTAAGDFDAGSAINIANGAQGEKDAAVTGFDTGFMVAFSDLNEDAQIVAKGYNTSGGSMGFTTIASPNSSSMLDFDLAGSMDGDQTYMLVWSVDDGGDESIFGSVLKVTSGGNGLEYEIKFAGRLSEEAPDPPAEYFNPSVAANGTNYFVAWTADIENGQVNILGKRVEISGSVSSLVTVADSTSVEQMASVSPMQGASSYEARTFVTAYEKQGTDWDICAREVKIALNGDITVNTESCATTASGNQTKPVAIAPYAGENQYPNRVAVYYEDDSSGTADIKKAIFNGETWATGSWSGSDIVVGSGEQSSPSVWLDATNIATWVVYEEKLGSDDYEIYAIKEGTSTPVRLTQNSGDDRYPSVTAAGDNALVVFQTTEDTSDVDIHGTLFNGNGDVLLKDGSSLKPFVLFSTEFEELKPKAAVCYFGQAFIAYAERQNRSGDAFDTDMVRTHIFESHMCNTNEDCNDGNVCTDDSCHADGICIYDQAAMEGQTCDDGLFCTGTSVGGDENAVCRDGICRGTYVSACYMEGQDVGCFEGICDEGIRDCTATLKPEDTPCDNGLYCDGENDHCDNAGQCLGEIDVCTTYDSLDQETTCVVESCNEPNIDEGDPAEAQCNYQFDDLLCADDSACNGTETCNPDDGEHDASGCLAGTPVDCAYLSDDCNDGLCVDVEQELPVDGDDDMETPTQIIAECQTDAKPNGTVCDDGNVCYTAGHGECTDGACGGAMVDCTDGATCSTDDGCDPIEGCLHTYDNSACTDGNACTIDTCSPSDPGAEAVTGCLFTPTTGACDDGDPCTENDTCATGSCEGTPKTCATFDGPCSEGVCNPTTGACEMDVSSYPSGYDCTSDHLLPFCTIAAECDGTGECIRTEAKTCTDDISCTQDECVDEPLGEEPYGYCTNSPVDDNCTGSDNICIDVTCDPSDPASDALTGCIEEYNSNACNTDPCLDNQICSGGECQGGTQTNCQHLDDGDCVVGVCDSVSGECVEFYPGEGATCATSEDCPPAFDCNQTTSECEASACTEDADCNDPETPQGEWDYRCSAHLGVCVYSCDDGNDCNGAIDHCDGQGVCQPDDDTAGCNEYDHLDCVVGECIDNDCIYTQEHTICDDSNMCTTEYCDWGCHYVDVSQGTDCTSQGDGFSCTHSEECDGSGNCEGTPNDTLCDDSDVCTNDTCSPSGCQDEYFDDITGCCNQPIPGCNPVDGDTDDEGGAQCDESAYCCFEGSIISGYCYINGECYHESDPDNPENACETCYPYPEYGGSVTQWTIKPNGQNCDDDDPCTRVGSCQEGVCIAGELVDCDDDDPCTHDTCDVDYNCVNTSITMEESCDGRECGPSPDGCYANCGFCQGDELCNEFGYCGDCSPDCSGKECGDNGCGGSCGTCPTGEYCNESGICACEPDCVGKTCGDDGCGGSCGTCAANETCTEENLCECFNTECSGACCSQGQVCDSGGDCCTTLCVSEGRECGDDGCGNANGCGQCGDNGSCENYQCVCDVGHTSCAGACCDQGQTCYNSACCTPNCNEKECGSDLCGGTCGECDEQNGEWCNAGQCDCDSASGYSACGDACCPPGDVCTNPALETCCTPDCTNDQGEALECGDNGCGGICGDGCSAAETCVAGFCECTDSEADCNGVCCLPDETCYLGVCCSPNCDGKECGSDGCGEQYGCGDCSGSGYDNQSCNLVTNQCECAYTSCGESCCAEGEVCFEGGCCQPDCDGKDCGSDGCGGTCGVCDDYANSYCHQDGETAVCDCEPNTCDSQGIECGLGGDDGCGDVLDCGLNCDDDNDCTYDLCVDNACVYDEEPMEGEDCDDNNLCTQPDTCIQGVCMGEAKDCSSAVTNTDCQRGACRSGTGECYAIAKNESSACNDGLFCTINTVCTSGECTGGEARDCGTSTTCLDVTCDESANQCVETPINEEGACDDGNSENGVNDLCIDGKCVGEGCTCIGINTCCDGCEAKPGSLGVTCTDDGVEYQGTDCTTDTCNANGRCAHEVKSGYCVIGEVCYPDGATNPESPCEVCDSGSSKTGWTTMADGETCDDGLFCTVGDVCTGGVCSPTGNRDCSGELTSPHCQEATCDDDNDECVVANANEGLSCNDGDACTIGDTCASGVCIAGQQKDCSHLDDDCNTGVCSEGGVCRKAAGEDGNSCDDGDACTQNDTCELGVCVGANPVDCSHLDTGCQEGYCVDEGSGFSCELRLVSNGTSCDDDDPCTTGDRCQAGVCQPTGQVDCSDLDTDCAIGLCIDGSCTTSPIEDGFGCNDGNACTLDDTCQAGVCSGGEPVVCEPIDSCHLAGSCNPETGECSNDRVKSDGASCDDERACTVEDACDGGICMGEPRICTADDVTFVDSACQEAVCDEAAGGCVAAALIDGTPCSDGQYCTMSDACRGGRCRGTERLCDSLTYDAECQAPVCIEDSASCPGDTGCCSVVNVNDGQSCNGGAGVCNDGLCLAEGCDCAGVNECCDGCLPQNAGGACDTGFECLEGACTENGRCEKDVAENACFIDGICYTDGERNPENPCLLCDASENNEAWSMANNQTSCDDGRWCTVDDVCMDGVCLSGEPRDCAGEVDADQCTYAVCDESINECIENRYPDGTSCNDGSLCTRKDECVQGVCRGGDPVICDAGGACVDNGACNPETGLCEFDQAADGKPCDDGNLCTKSDVCTGGECVGGETVVCEPLNDCHEAGVCDSKTGVCTNPVREDGAACDDGFFCTEGDFCEGGWCTGGQPKDCSAVITEAQCQRAACDDELNECLAVSENEGIDCEDGQYCTQNTKCASGVCTGGQPKDCSDIIPEGRDLCTTSECDDETDECLAVSANEGASCDDGFGGNDPDSCIGGRCLGDGCQCAGVNSCCDGCNILNEGGQCESDGKSCTVDACVLGECTHEPKANWCFVDDGCYPNGTQNPLNTCKKCDVSVSQKRWVTMDDGTECSDQKFCTVNDTCVNGYCLGGTTRGCADVIDNTQCQSPKCNETYDFCTKASINNDEPCNDGLYCTVGETCNNGVCQGGQTNSCSGAISESACQTVTCNEASHVCKVEAVNDGKSCDDGFYCTEGEYCEAGRCVQGESRACSDVLTNAFCQRAVCIEDEDLCEAENANEGLICDDGVFCTEGEVCTSGDCIGSPRVCDDGIPCTEDICSEARRRCQSVPRDDLICDDGLFCNGVEQCLPEMPDSDQNGCLIVFTPEVNDEIGCTIDACNETMDQVTHVPNDALCQSNNFCVVMACDPSQGCVQVTTQPDNTLCGQFDGNDRCFDGACVEMTEGEAYDRPIPLQLGVVTEATTNGRVNTYVSAPDCEAQEMMGADVFFSIELEEGKYMIRIEPTENDDFAAIVFDDVDPLHCREVLNETLAGETEEIGGIFIEESGTALIAVDSLFATDAGDFTILVDYDIDPGEEETDGDIVEDDISEDDRPIETDGDDTPIDPDGDDDATTEDEMDDDTQENQPQPDGDDADGGWNWEGGTNGCRTDSDCADDQKCVEGECVADGGGGGGGGCRQIDRTGSALGFFGLLLLFLAALLRQARSAPKKRLMKNELKR